MLFCFSIDRQNSATIAILKYQYVRGTDIYPHMSIQCPHAARSSVLEPRVNRCERRGGGGALADFGLQGEQSSMNCHAKLNAASFILGREIRNRTKLQTHDD